MDSEDAVNPAYNPDSPFSNSAAQGRSRIAEQIARQKKIQARTHMPDSLKKKAAPTSAQVKKPVQPAKNFHAKSNTAIKAINRRVDEKIVQIPAFSLSQSNIVRLRWLVGLQSFIILILVLTFGYGIWKLSEKNIYAARSHKPGSEDQVVPLQAMNSPTHTQQAILSWAATTATSMMNFGFHNATQRLSSMRAQFTDDGWQAYIAALENSQLLDNIVAKEQVITAAPVGAAVMVQVDELPGGGKQWIVQVPFAVTTISGKVRNADTRTITMTITSVAPTRNLTGLSIDNWIES